MLVATLYVENVPDELYEALREKARKNGSSISAEVLTLLRDYVPTARELRRRREWVRQVRKLQSRPSPSSGPFLSTEEMQREDRER
jgi:plasmid stability protein